MCELLPTFPVICVQISHLQHPISMSTESNEEPKVFLWYDQFLEQGLGGHHIDCKIGVSFLL